MHVIFSSKIKRKEISSRSRLKSLRALERASNSLYSFIIEYFFMSLLPSLWVFFQRFPIHFRLIFSSTVVAFSCARDTFNFYFHHVDMVLRETWGDVRRFDCQMFWNSSWFSQNLKTSFLQFFSNFDIKLHKNCVATPQKNPINPLTPLLVLNFLLTCNFYLFYKLHIE